MTAAYKSIFDVDMLIIDDLGTESQSSSRIAEFLNILNYPADEQYVQNRVKQLFQQYWPDKLYDFIRKVASRIIGSFSFFKFAGEDIRKNN
jgi:DNA replication protein DnaC